MFLHACFIMCTFAAIRLVIIPLSRKLFTACSTYCLLHLSQVRQQIKDVPTELNSWFILQVFPVTLPAKMSVSLTFEQICQRNLLNLFDTVTFSKDAVQLQPNIYQIFSASKRRYVLYRLTRMFSKTFFQQNLFLLNINELALILEHTKYAQCVEKYNEDTNVYL